MARDFPTFTDTSDASDFLDTASVPLTNSPMTMAIWANPAANDTSGICGIGTSGANNGLAVIIYQSDTNIAQFGNQTVVNTAVSSDTISPGIWSHFAMSVNSNSHCTAYINGGGKVTDSTYTNTDALIAVTRFSCGARSYGAPMQYGFDGSMAFPCIWNVQLTDVEIAILAAGAHPLTVRPQSIVSFWPLQENNDSGAIDIVGGFDMTENGVVGTAADPRIYRPTTQILQFPPAITATTAPLYRSRHVGFTYG